MSDNLLTRLFGVLSGQYGNKFTSLIQTEQSEEVVRKVWGNALADIPAEDIGQALSKLPVDFPDWPPTVGQFLAVCKIGKDPILRQSLPKPPGNPEKALEAIEEMKRILNCR